MITSIAIDGGNSMWATSQTGKTVFELTAGGGSYSFAPLPTCTPDAIAVDGSGNVWYASESDATLRELVGAGTPTVMPLAYAVANSKLGSMP